MAFIAFEKNDMNVRCPYFRRESRLQITCECTWDDVEMAVKFKNEGTKKEYIEENCAIYPNSCPIYQIVEGGYKTQKNSITQTGVLRERAKRGMDNN